MRASPRPRTATLDAPELSIVVPFYCDDPLPLARALSAQDRVPQDAAEIVLFDDGSPDPALTERVRSGIAELPVPARLVSSKRNLGRAAARNALAQAAQGAWLLYLDAGTQVPPGFLARHLESARTDSFDAAFGGIAVEPACAADLALHAALAEMSECVATKERMRLGPKAFCTGNLLVRRHVMRTEPFDEGFRGWGWEDSEWAVRAAKSFRLTHTDNPIRRLPSDTPKALLDKYRASAQNHARLLTLHPELADMPGARAAAALQCLPGQARLRILWSGAAQARLLPLRLRILALKLWRASWAAEAMRR